MATTQLRLPAEEAFKSELAALAKDDGAARPEGWKLSPYAVVTYVLGGRLRNGTEV